MIAYFDTSAFVPLLIDEPGTTDFARVWRSAEKSFATRLLFVEATSALTRARHSARISHSQHSRAVRELNLLWNAFFIVELDESLMKRAAAIAHKFRLRGYDSVHCAAAETVAGDDVIAASADRALLAVWHDVGVATFNPAVS